jgi:hypothetical protein
VTNLIDHAERELAAIGLDDPENDFYNGLTRTAVLEIIRVFADQGHSGMSASIVTSMVETTSVAEVKHSLGQTFTLVPEDRVGQANPDLR